MTGEAGVPGRPAGSRLRERVIRGGAIGLLGFGASQGLRLVSNMILSRLLFPEAFGLMAIIRLVQNGLEMISTVGLQPAIVRHERGDDPAFLNTGFCIQIMRGFALWATGALLAVPIATFYAEPQLSLLIPVSAVTALLTGLRSTKMISLRRHLQLGRLVGIEIGAQLLTLIVTIILAWLYRSVWVLVISGLVSHTILLLASHLAIPGPTNRLRWDSEAARQLFSFGKWIFVSTLFTFLALRMDVVMLGKLIPMEELGIYSIAIMVVAIPRQLSARIIQTVLLPALAESHRDSHERLARNFDRVRRVAIPGGLVALLGAVAVAPAFFIYLYDPRYHEAGWIAQLSMAGLWFGFLQDSSARALVALGDARSFAFSNGVRTAATAAGCIVGFAQAGLFGLILGVAVGALAGYLVIALRLRSEGMPVLWVDLGYSVVAIALGLAIGLGAPAATGTLDLAPRVEPGVTLVAGLLVLAPFAAWAALRIRNELRGRGAGGAKREATSDAAS